MITTYYFYVMFLTLAWIWGFEYVFKKGEIFGGVGEWLRDVLPEWVRKPTFDCKFCMSSVHGTIMFSIFLNDYPIYMWVIFCFCLTGLTAMISQE